MPLVRIVGPSKNHCSPKFARYQQPPKRIDAKITKYCMQYRLWL